MSFAELLEIFKQGGMTSIAIIALIVAFKKDRQVSMLYDRLSRKSDKYNEKYYILATEMSKTIESLSEIIDFESIENSIKEQKEGES